VTEFLPFIVIGLATGAVYGLAGLGLVLTYKTSGIFNFGYGALAALAAFVFYLLHVEHGVPWPFAAVLTVGVFAPAVGVAMELLARSLQRASETIKVVATVGLILVVLSIHSFWHDINQPTFPHFLPQSTVRMFDVNITWEQIILFLFSAAVSAVLYCFFRATRLGVVMRGLVDSEDLVSMSGDNPASVRRWAWIIGTAFAAIAGLLLAPDQLVSGSSLTILVFAAFGAAAIGFFDNLPLTFAGGLIIGVTSSLVDKYAGTIDWLGGIPPGLPFIFLFVVLVLTPRRRLLRRRLPAQLRVHRPYHAPIPIRLTAGAIAVAFLAIVPMFQEARLAVWSSALIDIILFLSLGLLVRNSGQISLCHLAFAAVGAAAFGHFASDAGLPWLLALVLAALVAVPVGALVAIPAARLSGVFLALATLGFGILAQYLFYNRGFMFGRTALGIAAPRPALKLGAWDMASDRGYYYVLLIITVVVTLALTAITAGRLGRLMQAMGDSQLALETRGTSLVVLKMIVFCISAAFAALAGALTASLFHYSVGTSFQPFSSLTLVVLVTIVTFGDPWYAVMGAVGRTVIGGYVHGPTVNNSLTLLFGISGVLAVYGTRATGMPRPLRDALDRLGGRTKPEPAGSRGQTGAGEGRDHRATAARTGLEIRDVSVQFGGIRAVDRVTMQAPMGRITGLIGPNGAGKTTTFNVCSGLARPKTGSVSFDGVDVTHESPSRRARRGLGRTYQRPELFDRLTTRQNVAMGLEASLAGARPSTQLVSSRTGRRAVDAATDEALAVTGTGGIADVQVGLLPIGQRRLVELATVLAGPFDMLLLDEPSSGLDGNETELFGRVLQAVASEWGRGILLVEHDMTLVRAVCEYVFVLDFGSLIFEGSPDEMLDSDAVRSAYLGSTVEPVATAE
jgi:ABC-type branched-subunit amino acid transport system ATPase component/ABC-type branched-subunit amino acid transport system permease subunit